MTMYRAKVSNFSPFNKFAFFSPGYLKGKMKGGE